MPDVDRRQQQPCPEAIRDIRNLLLTPNRPPRYPHAQADDAERARNRKRGASPRAS